MAIADSAREDLGKHLGTSLSFIRGALSDGLKVLVACRRGASRSVSVIVAHLMTERGISLLEAFNAVSLRRWQLWPNAGFVSHLLEVDKELRAAGGRPAMTQSDQQTTERAIGVHAAWAANQQNLRETGAGRKYLSLQGADALWEEATSNSLSLGESFERCKELALGVDL